MQWPKYHVTAPAARLFPACTPCARHGAGAHQGSPGRIRAPWGVSHLSGGRVIAYCFRFITCLFQPQCLSLPGLSWRWGW